MPRLLGWVTDSVRVFSDGAAEAGRMLAARNWRLLGGLAYYAFDNAVLWASFQAYGSAPPLGVILMGYLVGSLAAALPIPAGLGAVEGGLIGALVVYGAPATPAVGAVLLYRGISLGLTLFLSAGAWSLRRTVPPGRRLDRIVAPVFAAIGRHHSSPPARGTRRRGNQQADPATIAPSEATRARDRQLRDSPEGDDCVSSSHPGMARTAGAVGHGRVHAARARRCHLPVEVPCEAAQWMALSVQAFELSRPSHDLRHCVV